MASYESDSSLSSAASDKEIAKLAPIFQKAKAATKARFPAPNVSPPRPKRAPSPPHEDVFSDNPDIAFIVMFRSRFNDVLPSKLAHFGPQDVERGVTDQPPSPQVESLLCALLALVLNRKKPVERGHHGRALEEAVLSQKAQWPHSWQGRNPLHGNRDFHTMPPTERLYFLRTLIMWSLTSSEAVSTLLKDRYKQSRHNDDENQPLSVQPWGNDGDKRRYFLVQGMDDTNFRVYREGSRHTKNAHWYSVAGDIEDLKALATKLQDVDGTQVARRLAMKITNAIPTFEASEVKRTRREYRQIRNAAFTRPEPGFGIYEGRTRGKRPRYNYDDDDQADSDATSTRRSARNLSSRNTPVDAGPTFTASGRVSRQPRRGEYGEILASHGTEPPTDELSLDYKDDRMADGEGEDEDSEPVRSGRATRGAGRTAGPSNPRKRKHIDGYNDIDDMSDEEDAPPSGDEWDSDQNDAEGDVPDDEDEKDEASEEDAEDEEEDEEPQSLVIKLKVPVKGLGGSVTNGTSEPKAEPVTDTPEIDQRPKQKEDAPKAPKAEQHDLPNGYTAAEPKPLGVSPASAYPTPASASFPGADVRPNPTEQLPQTNGEVMQVDG